MQRGATGCNGVQRGATGCNWHHGRTLHLMPSLIMAGARAGAGAGPEVGARARAGAWARAGARGHDDVRVISKKH